jgi:hypothetical protein
MKRGIAVEEDFRAQKIYFHIHPLSVLSHKVLQAKLFSLQSFMQGSCMPSELGLNL